MHYIDFDGKNRRALVRLGLYTVAGVLIGALTTLFVLAAQGYDFDPRTGSIIKNGLILVDSEPNKAEVYIDGKLEEDTTPSRLPLPAGDYDVEIKKQGYRPWQRHVGVKASVVTWLYYPMLVPSKLDTDPLNTFKDVSFMEASPDGRRMVLHQPGSSRLLVYDMTAPTRDPAAVELPSGLLRVSRGSIGKLSSVQWSDNDRHILLKQRLDGTDNWVVVDLNSPSQSINLSGLTDDALGQVKWQPDSDRYLYSLVEGVVRRIDIEARAVSRSLANGATSYALAEDGAFYFVRPGDSLAQLRYFDGENDRQVGDLASGQHSLKLATFEGNQYLAASLRGGNVVELYRNPQRASAGVSLPPLAKVYLDDFDRFSFADGGRFLALQQGRELAVYDLEDERTYTFALGSDERVGAAAWIDEHRLGVNLDGRLTIMDFDGSNRYSLFDTDAQFVPQFDRSYRYLFTLQPARANKALKLLVSDFVAKP